MALQSVGVGKANKSEVDGNVQSLAFGLRILEYLGAQRQPVGVTALAAALGTNKNRIHRHLQTLLAIDFVARDAQSQRYRAGSRLFALARAVREQLDILSSSIEILRPLRDELGHSISISMVESEGIRVLHSLRGNTGLSFDLAQGTLLRFHSSAQGKVALAFEGEALLQAALNSRLEQTTPRTITDKRRLQREIELVRKRGWAVAPSEIITGVNALAVPIFSSGKHLAGTMAAIDFIQFLPSKPSRKQISRMVDAASRISSHLGFPLPKRRPSSQ